MPALGVEAELPSALDQITTGASNETFFVVVVVVVAVVVHILISLK